MLNKARQNKKGFSLVELIIVMAIMVALIAVLAPQFVKYVQRARDSSVTDAADNCFAVVKSEYALGNLVLADGQTSGTVVVTPKAVEGKEGTPITITLTQLAYKDLDSGETDFTKVCGVDSKSVNSKKSYTITVSIDATSKLPTFTMAETAAA